MSKFIGLLIAAVILWLGAGYAMGTLHIGAPDWYANYPCPKGTVLKTFWVKNPDPNAQYEYRGWQELGGCSASTQLSIG